MTDPEQIILDAIERHAQGNPAALARANRRREPAMPRLIQLLTWLRCGARIDSRSRCVDVAYTNCLYPHPSDDTDTPTCHGDPP